MAVLATALSALVALIGKARVAVAAAVAVPGVYAIFTKAFDFYVKWILKGRTSRGEYRIWIEDEAQHDWALQTGDVEKLIALHEKGGRIAHIEESVRFWKGNPYSLGLDLTVGAIAIDVASLIGGQGASMYLGWAVGLHVLFLIAVIALVLTNQQ